MDSFKVAYCEPKSKGGEVVAQASSSTGSSGLERTILTKDLRIMSAVDATDHGSAKTGARGGFATDENIASSNAGIKNRVIVSASQSGWVQKHGSGDSSLDGPLEGGGGGMRGGIGKFDQFKTNEEKFGVKSTYDETLYTTALNRSDFTREQQEKAAEIEKAILSGEGSSLKGNIHVLEERGIQSWADQVDEEARHSAVIRDPHQAALMAGTTSASSTGQSPQSNRFGNNNNNNRSQDFRGGAQSSSTFNNNNQQRQGSGSHQSTASR
jgi:PAB1-binding protein PBP1